MAEPEDPYGNAKRLAFCADAIGGAPVGRVLDVGCGTGDLLTRPLALRFPSVRFVGLDSDRASLDHARGLEPLANLAFEPVDRLKGLGPADLIIASEVIEHVEDPEAFLVELRRELAPAGRLIRSIKRTLIPGSGQPTPDTLAISPHISFFTLPCLRTVMARSGFQERLFKPRTALCGFVLDSLVRRLGLASWNARVADRLPPWMVSDWMFVLAPAEPAAGRGFRRGALVRWRRRLNERAFGVR
jgi:SAM-dependent methyltransferase